MTSENQMARAPMDRRVVAGCLDAAAIAALAAAVFLAHLTLTGMVMPLWSLSAIAVAWSVLPAWRWHATPGLWLVGLRIASLDGDRPDLIELTMRELVGRGIIAGAYLASLVVGVGGVLLGLGGFNIPTGFAFVLFVLAILLLVVAGVGQLAMLVRPDGRSLADLLGKVRVIEAPRAAPVAPEDADDEWLAHQRRRHNRMFVLSEAAVLGFGMLVPLANALHVPSIDVERSFAAAQDASGLATLKRRFEAEPANRETTYDLVWALRRAGDAEAAQAVVAKHEQARRDTESKREQILRSRFAESKSWESAEQLIILYDEQGRTGDGKEVWEQYVAADASAETLASYGIWLYQSELVRDAALVLDKAIAAGVKGGDAEAYLGLTLVDLGDKMRARRVMRQAIAKNSAWRQELQPRIEAIDAELKAGGRGR